MTAGPAGEEITRSYGIVTPIRNELPNIPTLIATVQGQEWRPALWIIVEDGSTDGSAEALDQAASTTPCLSVFHRPFPPPERRVSIGDVLREGVERGEHEARRRGVQVDYWAILDADVVLPPDYFRRLREALEANPQSGICSGRAQFGTKPHRWRDLFDLSNEPEGSARLWRAACLEGIGGVPAVRGWDVVSNALAMVRGWEIERLPELRYRARQMFKVEGVWDMQLRGGEHTAMLGYPLSFALVRAVRLLISSDGLASAAFLASYLRARAGRQPPALSAELSNYFKRRTGGAVIRERLRLLGRAR